jgi:hypothetical protein
LIVVKEGIEMSSNKCRRINLKRGEVLVYSFGKVKLHNYCTNDPMQDQVIVFENNGTAVVLENPSFLSSGRELAQYLRANNICPVGKLLSYHLCGGKFLPGVLSYSTKNAIEYGQNGAGAAMVREFKKGFGDDFDSCINTVDELVEIGDVQIDGFKFELIKTAEAFDVVLPDLRVLYLHMLGGDSHSIVPSKTALDAMMARFTIYWRQDYDLILSSHHIPEDNQALGAKIEYLRTLDAQARAAETPQELVLAMKKLYPNHKGTNYLEMTAVNLMGPAAA